MADSVKNSTSDTVKVTSETVKTVAEHFTLMNLVSHDGMDELTMERVAALDRGISRLGRDDDDYRIKQLGKVRY